MNCTINYASKTSLNLNRRTTDVFFTDIEGLTDKYVHTSVTVFERRNRLPNRTTPMKSKLYY